MSTEPWPAGYGRRVLAEIGSTSAEAIRLAPELTGPEWILTLNQTGGRGRRGRVWRMPPGNFAASLLIRLGGTPDQLALRSFVAALAVFDAVVAVTGRAEGLALKWPNDVLLNGGKLSGILLESPGQGVLVIGIGVNLAAAPPVDDLPPGAVAPVSLLEQTGLRVAPEAFLTVLAAAFARYEAQFCQLGFAPIRQAWLARAARLGQVITARMTHAELTGRFETVDEAGQLVLSTAGARHAIPAADVFF